MPCGYHLDETGEPGFVVLRAADGRKLAWFSATGADREEMERTAWEDFGGREGPRAVR